LREGKEGKRKKRKEGLGLRMIPLYLDWLLLKDTKLLSHLGRRGRGERK